MKRAFARRALSASLIVAMAFVAVWGGRALLWCPAMERSVEHCCCPSEGTPPLDVAVIARASCCETKVFEAAPAPSVDERTGSAGVGGPLLAAVLPPRATLSSGAAARPPRRFSRGRSGLAPPSAPLYLRNCVQLL